MSDTLNNQWKKFRLKPHVVEARIAQQEGVVTTAAGDLPVKPGDVELRREDGTAMSPTRPERFLQLYEPI